MSISAVVHIVLLLMILFDVMGIGGGFGLGIGPGFGIGSGGGAGLGKEKRRQIYSLEDLPQVVRPRDPKHDQEVKDLVVARTPDAVVIPQPAKPQTVSTSPVVKFARPVTPLGAGTDLGARFASTGAGTGGFGVGGGGGGGFSLGSLGISLDSAFGKYVGGLRKVGLDVAIVVDATGSMQNVIDEIKHRLDDLVFTMQRLVPTARIGAVAYRDRDDGKTATAPRQSEDFLVKWTDLSFKGSKVKDFLDGIVAEGGGDWEEAVKDGFECAMKQLKWRPDAKKVIILVGSSPPHDQDVPALRDLVQQWQAQGGVVSTIDVSLRLHEEHERKLHRWLYGDELKTVSPLPDFYKQVQDSFEDISRRGGGQSIALGQDQALVRYLLVLTFGQQWEKDVSRVARNR
ncbi:MAG TPA: vWA domain-containing protein [Candidatus Binatia bacterium]|nr:vWA domain-containing protein [Candidatus Binatia bacterium]